jgi:hypothetical protein
MTPPWSPSASVNLADNTAPVGPDIYGDAQSRGFNLVKDTAGGTLDTAGDGNTAEGNLIDVDPRLGPLLDNGGPTWTRALLFGVWFALASR